MGKLTGVIVDKNSGEQIEARVKVLASSGVFAHPTNAILKVGPGEPFFYSDGSFEVEVGRGAAQIIVERGTEYAPANVTVDMPSNGTETVEILLERWTTLQDSGWHPGNTHIHYDEKETRPDERLSLDPRVEDLRMTAVSVLKRWDLEYATNKYPPGMLTEFSTAHHYVQSGEESRHNSGGWETGYGHIMLLNLRNIVEPLSRGAIVDAFDPDYPPLSYACDDAHRQGGIVIWCHNGQGMEAPVAAALGKLDAFNLFDPNWNEVEYDIYYRMLNAGMRLPASTGSDWFISSANRVYADTGAAFDYEGWLDALKKGKTFITNGPVVYLSVNGQGPGSEVTANPGDNLSVEVTWESHYPVRSAELLVNGLVPVAKTAGGDSTSGTLKADVTADFDGWIAARLFSADRDSFAQPLFAHTSPVYVTVGRDGPHKS
ncbi:MAG: CehA/McbA family metallohydrolase, partial [SAR202 cluster bacterium]|nr:CehA/McbA family metallohydrolase [SAR202 cluster bacterium]